LKVVHEDHSSMLMLDRQPVEWRGSRQRGLSWFEGDARIPPAQLDDWQAAGRAGACGLVLEGRRRFLQTAANGLAPIYWMQDGKAIYFASRIDPLARSSPTPLSIDWDAWAAIVALRYPLGTRTPFAEIRRLPQSATLSRRLGRSRVAKNRWAWTEVEPDSSLAVAAEGVAAAVVEALAPLPTGVVCPLSGGRDSRMLFLTLGRDGRAAAAVTVPDDEGDTHEEDFAAPVAAALGVPHERIGGTPEEYWGDWQERAWRIEYEFVDHAWLVPLAHRVAGLPAPVPDGFAIDSFFSVGRHFYTPKVLQAPSPRACSEELFESLRGYGHAHLALSGKFHEPIVSRAREQFLAIAEQFEGHPSQAFLTFYATRSLRGVSTYATKLLGNEVRVVTPGATTAMVQAALSITHTEKVDGRLYQAVFEILAPEVSALPSTAYAPRRASSLPRRWCSPPALEAQRRSLREGPLAPHLSPELRAWLEGDPAAAPEGHLRLGVESISLMHAWWRRYRDFLREVDPADLLG